MTTLAAIATPTTTRLAVVMLNWNGAADTERAAAALRAQLGERDRLIVVDNASTPDQRERLARLDGVTLLHNERNLGFAGGTNVGVRRALADGCEWVLWWNNDAIPDAGALDELLATATRLQLDAAQPLLVREGDRGVIDSAGLVGRRRGGAVDWLRGRPIDDAPPAPTEILGPCGAAALWRADALRRCGLMDDALFTLFEDLDQTLRLRQAGGRAMLVPRAVATHRRGASAPQAAPRARRLRKLWVQRNVVHLMLRDWPLGALLAQAPTLLLRTAQALWLARGTAFACLPLWRRALAERPAARARMRAHGVDRMLAEGAP